MTDTTDTTDRNPRDAGGPDQAILPLLALTTGVVLPQMVVTLALETDEARTAAAAAEAATATATGCCCSSPRSTGATPASAPSPASRTPASSPTGCAPLVLRGLHRAVVGAGVVGTGAALWVEAEPVADVEPTDRAQELAREYRATVAVIAEKLHAGRLTEALQGVADPGALADTAGWWPDLSVERRVELLETLDVEARLEKVVAWARDALEELEVTDRIRTEVADGMEKTQREFLLRQQLEAIRKELGEGGDGEDVVEQFRTRIAEAGLPDAVREAADREVDRLERTSEQSPEHGWIRTWLDTMLELPWGTRSEDMLDVVAGRAVLDADHTGLDDVKDRIVEFLAVRKLRADRGLDDADAAEAVGGDSRRRARARSWPSSVRRVSARRRSASRWRARSSASSCASRSAACATRPRSAATGAPTSVPARAASCGPSTRPGR